LSIIYKSIRSTQFPLHDYVSIAGILHIAFILLACAAISLAILAAIANFPHPVFISQKL